MKYLNHRAYLLGILASSMVACLNLGTQTETGGSGGSGDSVSSSSSGGGSSPSCPECTFGRRYGDDADQNAFAFALADDGSVYISGVYNGQMFLGPNVGLIDNNGTPQEVFLAKLDRQGNAKWIVNPKNPVGPTGFASEVAIANGIVAWGGSTGPDPNPWDMFVEIRTLADDKLIATTRLGSQWHDELTSLALSPDGKTVYVAGIWHG